MAQTNEEIKAELIAVHDEEHEDDDAYDRWESVDKGEWVSEHKYEHKSTVYRHKPSGRLFRVDDSRSGSYWSDYEYDDATAVEVRAVQVTVTQYEEIREGSQAA